MTSWARECPRCEHVEHDDAGPGRRASAPRCPKCRWPMNSIDLDVRDDLEVDEVTA